MIASLKDRLKEEIDEALKCVAPNTVCEKMVAAVKAALYGAKDVSGLQVRGGRGMGRVCVYVCVWRRVHVQGQRVPGKRAGRWSGWEGEGVAP